jgi:hypothetical protein
MGKFNSLKQKSSRLLTKKNSCAPGKGNNSTCFDHQSLTKIASHWNNKNPNDKISINKNSTDIWKQINKRMSSKCNTETCWLKQDFIKKISNNLQEYFKPKIPKSWLKEKNTWLTTTDIENVIFQYEKAVPDFKFLGVVPIDFDYEYSMGKCIVDEICRINIKKLKSKKINRIGIIFNLDAHDEPGSHWVALYSDFNKGEVYYYDSYGIFPPEEVKILMERMSIQGLKIKGEPFKLYYNDIRHQYKNSECGVYSMHFITEFLNGKTFKEIIQNRISDDNMNQKRKIFYNTI